MFLCNRIIQNFVESMDEHEFAKLELMNDSDALDYISHLYEETFGAKPSGIAVFLIKNKFKLQPASLVACAA